MRRWIDGFDRVLTYIAVVITLIMAVLTTLDATGRYVFNRPITGAYEITAEYLIVISVFFAAGYAYRKGAYIRVTFVVDRLPRSVRVYVDYFSQVMSALAGALLVIATAQQAIRTFAGGTTSSGVLAFPLGPAYAVVPLGLLFMTLPMFLDIARVRTGQSVLLQEEAKEEKESVVL